MMPLARTGCRSALLPRRRPHTGHTAHAAAGSRGTCVAAGGCSALAQTRELSLHYPATGRSPAPLDLVPELGSL